MAVNHKLEHDVQNEIRIWCGEHDLLAIRINVGLFKTIIGERIVDAGPPKGWPDLEIYGRNGKMCFCETKTIGGYVRPDQKKVHAILKDRGFKVIIPKTLEAFIKEIESYGLN